MLAALGTQREQAFFRLLQLARVQIHGLKSAVQKGLGLRRLVERPAEGGDGPFQRPRRLFGDPFQIAERRLQGAFDALAAAQARLGPVHGLDDLFPVHHHGAFLGQFALFAGLRGQGRQFTHGMAQEFLVPAGGFQGLGRLGAGLGGILPDGPGLAASFPGLGQAAEGIQQCPVLNRVQQTLVVELAVDFDQILADPLQQADADRRIIDESARAAIRPQRTAQDNQAAAVAAVVQGGNAMFFKLGQDRGARSDLKGRRDGCRAATGAYKAGLGPSAQRQTQGIQKDRFSGPRFAGQHTEPGRKIQHQTVNEYDIPDGQVRQHGPVTRTSCGRTRPSLPPPGAGPARP